MLRAAGWRLRKVSGAAMTGFRASGATQGPLLRPDTSRGPAGGPYGDMWRRPRVWLSEVAGSGGPGGGDGSDGAEKAAPRGADSLANGQDSAEQVQGGGNVKKKSKRKEELNEARKTNHATMAKHPGQFSRIDVARYYEIKDSEMEQYMPEGIDAELQQYFDLMLSRLLMVREPAIDIIELMKKIASGEGNPNEDQARILTGRRGIGKSAVLLQVILWARMNDWIVMYNPGHRRYVTEAGAVERGTDDGIPVSKSRLRPSLYTQPLGAQEMLGWIQTAHGDKLSTIPKRRNYPEKLYSSSENLDSIIERGMRSRQYAGDAVLDLRLELGLVEEFPVLIACDEFNSCYWPTCFYVDEKPLLPHQLMTNEIHRMLTEEGEWRSAFAMKRGMMLYASTAKHRNPVHQKELDEQCKDLGFRVDFYKPFIREGDDLVVQEDGPVKKIKVPFYDERELRNAALSYKRAEFCNPPDLLDPVRLKTLEALTGMVPIEVHKTMTKFPNFYDEEYKEYFRPYKMPRTQVEND